MGKLYRLIYYVFPKNVKCLNLDSYKILFFSMIKQPMSLKSFAFIARMYGVHTCIHVQRPCRMVVVYSTTLLRISSDRSLNGPGARTAASKSQWSSCHCLRQVLESRHVHSHAGFSTDTGTHLCACSAVLLLSHLPAPLLSFYDSLWRSF